MLRQFRVNLALLIVALYLLLEAAFMLVRVPPGTINSVPTGEILIVFFLATAMLDTHLVAPFARSLPILPLAIWWAVGSVQLAVGVSKYGFWAMRDATSLVESLFLWVGFVVASQPGAIEKIVKWFWHVLFLTVLIALTYPFRGLILNISPVIISAQMKQIPLFFTYQMTPIMTLVAGFALLLSNARFRGMRLAWLGGVLFIFVAALWQARTIYMQIGFLVVLLALTRPARMSRLLIPMAGAVALFFLAVAVGVPIPGRLSGNVSISFYLEHFMAILGEGGSKDEAIRGAAGGVSQRLNWWGAIWENVTSTWDRTLFGLGYGVSLVGLAYDTSIDPTVREPHNSLISALGRTGFVGLFAYVWMHLSLAWMLIQTYRAYAAKGFAQTANFIYVVGAMFVLFWLAAVGEDAFEKPYLAIPYYFLYGVIANLWHRDRFGTRPQNS